MQVIFTMYSFCFVAYLFVPESESIPPEGSLLPVQIQYLQGITCVLSTVLALKYYKKRVRLQSHMTLQKMYHCR
jgi:hypothetical protein